MHENSGLQFPEGETDIGTGIAIRSNRNIGRDTIGNANTRAKTAVIKREKERR